MAFKHDELTCFIHYTSIRDAESQLTLQNIIFSVFDISVNPQHGGAAQQYTKFSLIKHENGDSTWVISEDIIKQPSEPLLVAISEYWRKNVFTEVPKLKAYLLDIFENNLSSVNVWQASESVCFVSAKPLSDYLPPDVLGITANTVSELKPSIHADVDVGTDIEAAENIEIEPKA